MCLCPTEKNDSHAAKKKYNINIKKNKKKERGFFLFFSFGNVCHVTYVTKNINTVRELETKNWKLRIK